MYGPGVQPARRLWAGRTNPRIAKRCYSVTPFGGISPVGWQLQGEGKCPTDGPDIVARLRWGGGGGGALGAAGHLTCEGQRHKAAYECKGRHHRRVKGGGHRGEAHLCTGRHHASSRRRRRHPGNSRAAWPPSGGRAAQGCANTFTSGVSTSAIKCPGGINRVCMCVCTCVRVTGYGPSHSNMPRRARSGASSHKASGARGKRSTKPASQSLTSAKQRSSTRPVREPCSSNAKRHALRETNHREYPTHGPACLLAGGHVGLGGRPGAQGTSASGSPSYHPRLQEAEEGHKKRHLPGGGEAPHLAAKASHPHGSGCNLGSMSACGNAP
jgi:hypothetical protein